MRRRSTGRGLLPLAAVLAAVVSGCGTEAASAPPEVERADSVGVEVVVNRIPEGGEAPAWSVGSEPELAIGVLEGAPEYQLFRVVGAHRFDDGRIVVANSGTHQLRFYGPDGRHLRDVGAEGDGPGEFRRLSGLWAFAGDSLAVFDGGQRTLSVFDSAGTWVRSYRFEGFGDEGFPLVRGVRPDGGALVQEGTFFRFGEATTGSSRSDARLSVGTPEGGVDREIGRFPGSESFVLQTEEMMSVRSLAFGRRLHTAVLGERIAVGNDDAYSIRLYGQDGTTERVVRLDEEPRAVTEADYDALLDEALASIEDDGHRARTRRMFQEMPRRESLPAYRRLLGDPDGRLWVERERPPGEEQPVWDVFGADGALVGRVGTPTGVRVLQVGTDRLLGVETDDFDVERIVVHSLERPGRD